MRHALRWGDLDFGAELGSGHAGTVFRARLRRAVGDLPEGTVVAVKRYRPWVLEQPGQFERIFRELESGRAVAHAHLVSSIGIIGDDDGRPSLVMRYYEGETLESFLVRHRASESEVDGTFSLMTIGALAGALGALHRNEIIHRDVKPANVILTRQGPVLMDLGVVSSDGLVEGTTTQEFLGTIRYAAPEYLFGKSYDFSIDTFSLGAIAYELFIGEQYDEKYQHWAELVASRLLRPGYVQQLVSPPFAGPKYYRRIKTLGLRRLCFMQDILSRSLAAANSRRIALSSLEAAVAATYWNTHYHFEDDRIVEGPPNFHPLGDFDGVEPQRPFHEVIRDIKVTLSISQRERLHEMLRDQSYWGPLIPPWPANVDDFYQLGMLKRDFNHSGLAIWHPAVRYAYRTDEL